VKRAPFVRRARRATAHHLTLTDALNAKFTYARSSLLCNIPQRLTAATYGVAAERTTLLKRAAREIQAHALSMPVQRPAGICSLVRDKRRRKTVPFATPFVGGYWAGQEDLPLTGRLTFLRLSSNERHAAHERAAASPRTAAVTSRYRKPPFTLSTLPPCGPGLATMLFILYTSLGTWRMSRLACPASPPSLPAGIAGGTWRGKDAGISAGGLHRTPTHCHTPVSNLSSLQPVAGVQASFLNCGRILLPPPLSDMDGQAWTLPFHL